MTVRLGFDARVLCRQELRGIGTYTVRLLRALRSIRPEWQFVFFADRPITNPSWSEGAEVVVRGPERGSRWHVWERVGLPWHASRAHISLLHSPANVVPEWTSMPRVVTIHDVIPYVPEAADASVAARDLGAAARAARRATAVITDSEASKADIVRVFGVAPERLFVVPLATESTALPTDESQTLSAIGVSARFVLALAASERRKNLPGVIATFARVAAVEPDLQLVLTGVDATLQPRITAMLSEHRVPADRVLMLGFVPDSTRNALYAGARAFLFLTLYEGFGLPILEALHHGTVVVCSNRSSCPEVAGGSALLVDPTSAEASAEAVLRAVRMTGDERTARIAEGRRFAAGFTWDRTARLTLAVYEQVLASSGNRR